MEGIRNLDEEWKEERDRARREGGRRRGGGGNRSAACGGYHVGDAIAMPFANINFSELIKIVYTLFHDTRIQTATTTTAAASSSSATAPSSSAECMRFYFTSHSVHVGRHVAGVLCGPESEIGVLVVTVDLVVFCRHRHRDYSSSETLNNRLPTTALSRSDPQLVVVVGDVKSTLRLLEAVTSS